MQDFICIYFGHDSNNPGQWWNITARGFASAKQAEKHGLYMMPTAGVFGFAVVSETEDTWQVNDDLSILPPNVSIGLSNGQYNIQPAKQLQFV